MIGPAHAITDDISALVQHLVIEFDELSATVIEQYVKRSIIDFCERSQFWQEDIGPITVAQGVDTYAVAGSRYQGLVQIKGVFYVDDDGQLKPLQHNADRFGWHMVAPDELTISPLEELTGRRLHVLAALRPAEYQGSFRVSRTIIDEFFEALLDGTRAKILRLPRKPFTDPNLAMQCEFRFTAACDEALRQQGRGFNRLPQRVAKTRREYY